MPGAPAKIKREDPRQRLPEEMREQKSEENQPCDMDCEHPVFIEIFLGMIGAVNGRHVMRVVKNQCQRVETYRPGNDTGVGGEVAEQQQRGGPGAASDNKIEGRVINPKR